MLTRIVESKKKTEKQTKFCDVVTIINIPCLSQEEKDELFWKPEDFQRMRSEDQIHSTRRARSRVREMKRRLTEASIVHAKQMLGENNMQDVEKQGCSMGRLQHADSLRLTQKPNNTQEYNTANAAWHDL